MTVSLAQDPWQPLPGTLAVVTGAAGGIGRTITERLLEVGAAVLASDLNEPALDALAQELDHERLFTASADVSEESSVERLAERARELPYDLTLWVNNAGVGLRKAASELSGQDWDRILGINGKSVLFGSQAAYRVFLEQGGGGAIVNLSSVAGIVSLTTRNLYGTSKAAVIHLTRQLAQEWGPDGVRVNAVAPGFVLTPISHLYDATPEQRAEAVQDIPLGRLGVTDDIATAVLVLGSGLSGYQTGQVSVIDGGLTLG